MAQLPESFIARLAAARGDCHVPVGAQASAEAFARELLALLFPHFAAECRCSAEQVRVDAAHALETVQRFIATEPALAERAPVLTEAFAARLPALYDALVEDAQATYDADPAARSLDEVVLAYPGFFALACYRFAHELHKLDVPLLPRLVTEFAHGVTGIDIHPGAVIGRAISIDHGTGIVIGETSIVGNRVRFYQGVTLGALTVKKGAANVRRHPTIEDDVVLYANATILGGHTTVGARSVIGGNVWLTRSVPPDSVVTEVPNFEHRPAVGEDRP